MANPNVLTDFRNTIAQYLVEIADEAQRWNVPLSRLTLIARDPTNDQMFIVLTNEPEDQLAEAYRAAQQPPTNITEADQ